MNGKARIVFHVDMDHFYTAIEERENPSLRGKVVVVGADPKEGKGRGVVHTCNYEARKLGIRSGMPISRAWKLSHEAIYLRPDFSLYMKVSNKIMKILRKHAQKFEQWGIDEAFMDVTSRVEDFFEAEELAKQIKEELYNSEKLTCSIGIGPNKSIAKIASDHQKPNGLTIVRNEEAEAFLASLSVRKLLWVGRKTEQKLLKLGIKTIGDLAGFDPAFLVEKYGSIGTQLYLMSHGIDVSEVKERREVKSISREMTFEEDTADREQVLKALVDLSKEIFVDMEKQGFCFRTVTIKVRYKDFETHLHGKTLPRMTRSLQDLVNTASKLVQSYLEPERKIRLVGVKASGLVSTEKQKTLF